jgi:hypothetical protein
MIEVYAFDKIMRRRGGKPPRENDEILIAKRKARMK